MIVDSDSKFLQEMKDDPNYAIHFWNKRLFLYEIRYKNKNLHVNFYLLTWKVVDVLLAFQLS